MRWSFFTSFHFRSSYMIYFVYIYHIHLFHENIWTHNWQAPNISGYIQLVRASHRYREVLVQTPLKSWIFSGFLRNCINCVHNCEDHSSLETVIVGWIKAIKVEFVKPDSRFLVSLELRIRFYSPVNLGIFEAQHQTNCKRIVFNAI